jgi:hypothetical protein
MTFVGVGIMASIAAAGLLFGIPRGIDKGLSVPSIRLAVIRQVPLLGLWMRLSAPRLRFVGEDRVGL